MQTEQNNASHAGGPRASGSYEVEIAGLDLVFRKASLNDPVPTGRQIAESFSGDDPTEVLVLQVLSNGQLEELRPDETTNLLETGVERFVVVRIDRTFRLEIDGRRQEWPAPVISAMSVKTLGKQTGDHVVVVLQQTDTPDRQLEDDELVALTEPGIERFVFKHVAGTVVVTINERHNVTLRRGVRTGLEIKQAAIEQGVPIAIDFVLSLESSPGRTRIIGDADRIRVKDGQHFIAVADDDNS